jgi:hypothetical protein
MDYKFSTNTVRVSKLEPFFERLLKDKEDCPRITEVTPIVMPTYEDIYMKILKGEDTGMPPVNIDTFTFETVIEYKIQHNAYTTFNAQLIYKVKIQPINLTQYKCVKQYAQLKISNVLSQAQGLLCSNPLVVQSEDEDLRWFVLETVKMCQDSNEKLLKQYNCC